MLATLLKCSSVIKSTFNNQTLTLDNPNAHNTPKDDYFGYSVDISGNYAIVGAYQEDDATGNESGAAYIFNVVTGALITTLRNPNQSGISNGDNFGFSVGISGNYAIVGVPYEEFYNPDNINSGKAYIFEVNTGNLVQILHDPNPYGTAADDRFGYSVAINGNYAIVGAHFEDDASGTSSGKAYVFDIITGNLVSTLNNPNAYGTSKDDFFGFSVDISGNYAIVGAYQEESGSGTSNTNSGKAYVFDIITGNLVSTLNNPNAYGTNQNDYFGYSVAINGNYAIVGAYQEDESGNTSSGKAYIFNIITGALSVTLNNPNAYSTKADDRFGYSVDISGNYAIVGAYQEDDATGTNSGKAYIFEVLTGSLVKTLNNPNPYGTSKDDDFGTSVAISGGYAIVGAYLENESTGTNSGKAYIFS